MNKFVKSLKWEWRMNRGVALVIIALTAAALVSYGLYYYYADQLMPMDHSQYMDPTYQKLNEGMYTWESWLNRFVYLASGLAVLSGGIAMYRRLGGDRRHLSEINPTDAKAKYAAEFLFHLVFIVVTVSLMVAYRKMNYIKIETMNPDKNYNHWAIPLYFVELLPQVLLTTAMYLAAGWMATAFCARLYSNKFVKLAMSAAISIGMVFLVYYMKSLIMDAIWPLYNEYFSPAIRSNNLMGFFAFIGHIRNDVGGIGQAGRLVEAGYSAVVLVLCVLGGLYMMKTAYKPISTPVRNVRVVQATMVIIPILILLLVRGNFLSLNFTPSWFIRYDKAALEGLYDVQEVDLQEIEGYEPNSADLYEQRFSYTPKKGENEALATALQKKYPGSITDMEYFERNYGGQETSEQMYRNYSGKSFNVSARHGLVDEDSYYSGVDELVDTGTDMGIEYKPGLMRLIVTYDNGDKEEYITQGGKQYLIVTIGVDGRMETVEFHPTEIY